MKNKKALVSMYITFMMVAVIIVMITAVFAPMATEMASEVYVAGYDMLLDANTTLNQINDTGIRDSIQGAVNSASDAQENNILVTSSLFKYSFIFVIAIAGIVMFLWSRQLVEFGGGGFV